MPDHAPRGRLRAAGAAPDRASPSSARDILLLSLGGVAGVAADRGACLPGPSRRRWPARLVDRRGRAAVRHRRPHAAVSQATATTSWARSRARSMAPCSSLARRVNELAHDRRHLRAILSGMVEGVVVIDDHGRLVMANERRARHAEARRLGHGPALSGVDATAGDLRATRWPPIDGEAPARRRVHARARSVAHVCRPRGPGRRARGRRDPRAARHQRPAARRSRAPRLRRQRLARAAHAADGHPRLRRGAARRTAVVRSRAAGFSRSSRATPTGWSGW